MSYLGSWAIDDLLTFAVQSKAGTTGILTDADGNPAYRVYEDETSTAILTGTMAKLDDANTTGFYSEQITLSAANGFEAGKCYHVYIVSTVGGVAIGELHNFQILADINVKAISDDITAADILETWTDQSITGTADTGTTTTMVDAARTEADTDYWKGATIVFTSGNLAGQARLITAFDPGNDEITFSPAVTQAVDTHTYEIIPEASLPFAVGESTLTYQQMFRLMLAALAGKVSGMDGLAPVFRNVADSKARITVTGDQYGNRSSVTLDGTD